VISALQSKNFSGSAKHDRFKVSLFLAATIMVHVAFDQTGVCVAAGCIVTPYPGVRSFC
jgi:hypothetical protein